jgi:hypothetical protein
VARVLAGPQWTLHGILVHQDGAPAPGVALALRTVRYPLSTWRPAEVMTWCRSRLMSPVQRTARSDEEGKFVFQVPAGGYYEGVVTDADWLSWPMDVRRAPPDEPVIWVVERREAADPWLLHGATR